MIGQGGGAGVVPAGVGPVGENSAAVAEFKGDLYGHRGVVGVVRFVGLSARALPGRLSAFSVPIVDRFIWRFCVGAQGA